MEKALRNLDEANKAVLRAFNQALEIAEDTEQEHPRRGGRPDVRVPDGVEPPLNDIAEILGLSEDELVERMGRGLALAAIANERGFSEDDFKERVLALVRERVDGLIADGDLNGDDAAAIVDKVRDEAERHLVRVISDEESRSEGIPFSTEDLALIFKIEASELVARLHNDESLLQIAEELGLTRERLLDEMISLARTRADALIERGAMRRRMSPGSCEPSEGRSRSESRTGRGGTAAKTRSARSRPRPWPGSWESPSTSTSSTSRTEGRWLSWRSSVA